MAKKTVDDYGYMYNTIINGSKDLSDKSIRRIITELFIPILERDGYKINRDSMRRHSYLEYIVSKRRGKFRQTIGVSFNQQENITTKDEIEELVAGCTIDSIDSVIFISNVQTELNAEEFDKNLYPVKFQQFNFDKLGKLVQQVVNSDSHSLVTKILRECTQLIIEAVLNDPEALDNLEWRDVERMVAELFLGLGFDVELTPPAKDGGKDLILDIKKKDRDLSYIVEIKHWRSRQKVGSASINKFVKIIANEKRSGGLFLSTYGVSSGAVESLTKLERRKVKFGDKEKIVSLCGTYLNTSGLWLKDIELEKILMKNTL